MKDRHGDPFHTDVSAFMNGWKDLMKDVDAKRDPSKLSLANIRQATNRLSALKRDWQHHPELSFAIVSAHILDQKLNGKEVEKGILNELPPAAQDVDMISVWSRFANILKTGYLRSTLKRNEPAASSSTFAVHSGLRCRFSDCGNRFSTNGNLEEHNRIVHENTVGIQCSRCEALFASELIHGLHANQGCHQ